MSDTLKNIASSVKQRLVNQGKQRGMEFQRILVLYGMERLLYRLSVSPFADHFILKGASLFSLWLDEPHRRTRDVDLLGKDEPDTARFAAMFATLCQLQVPEDGLRFDAGTVKAKPIREENEFGGIRVTLVALLDQARIPMQVDIGFGDATVPAPVKVAYPTLLTDFAAPQLLAYQKETTIAEKLHALVILERGNSRMKDFFDLYVLAQEFSFTMATLSAAVHDAFARRSTALPITVPDGLTQDFAQDPAKQTQWRAFLKQNVSPPRDTLALPDVIAAINGFLLPVIDAARDDYNAAKTWEPGGPWKTDVLT
jgi:predicted nucleotidyltransferase component of viral defense system